MNVLKCAVPATLWRQWASQFSPPTQPFYVSDLLARQLHPLPCWSRAEFRALGLPLTFTDTFRSYAVSQDASWVFLLDETTYLALPPAIQAALLDEQQRYGRGLVERRGDWQAHLPELSSLRLTDGGLFVWWPSLWQRLSAEARQAVLLDFITADRLAHRGDELTAGHWERVRRRLPGVPSLAGTFAAQSGPNCLSTTLAAFGVAGVADLWLHGGPFERWLQAVTVEGGDLDALGTILVWRDAANQVQHAAVSLGEGWLFHKEAQNWWAPRQIVRLSGALARWDEPGWRVTPHVLQGKPLFPRLNLEK